MRRLVARYTCLAVVVCLLAMVPGSALAAPKWLKALQLREQAINALGQKPAAQPDWNEAAWAIESLARARARGIVRGYQDGLFRPNQAVKQAEALVMVARALGLEKDALELGKEYQQILPIKGKKGGSLRGVVPDKWLPYMDAVEPPVYWALGYILLAIDKDWVDAAELRPAAAASRAWVAMVLVRAMGLKEQALQASGTSLSFKDAAAIPDDKVGYVAVAVQQGLISGYPDNTFKPEKAVTRAELATILDRLHESEGVEFSDIEVKGFIVAVEGSKVKLSVRPASQQGSQEQVQEFNVSPDALVVLDGKLSSLDKLQPGYSARLFLNASRVAVVVICKSKEKSRVTPAEEVLEGEIAGITQDSTGWKLTIRLQDGSTREVRLAGSAFASPEQLRVQDRVRVRLREGMGIEVVLLSAQQVSGRIVSIVTTQDQVRLTVRTQENNEVTYTLGPNATITYQGQALAPADLKPGDSVVLQVENGVIKQVNVTARD